jgi:hypothetical protein
MAQHTMKLVLLLVSITMMIHALPTNNQNEEPLPKTNKIKNITVVQEIKSNNIIGNSTSIKRNGLTRSGAITVVFYQDSNFNGAQLWFNPVDYNGCYSLSRYGWANVASSVNIGGGCIELHESENCVRSSSNSFRPLYPDGGGCRQNDLAACNFNDRTKSFKRC